MSLEPPSVAGGSRHGDATTGITALRGILAVSNFVDPVLSDVRTRTAYGLPKEHWAQGSKQVTLKNVLAYDSPLVSAEHDGSSLVAR